MGDKLEDFIRSNQEEFDLEEPKSGHLDRFEARLGKEEKKSGDSIAIGWRNLLKVAAVVIFVLGSGIWISLDNTTVQANDGLDLEDISPELSEVQAFYTTQISNATEELAPIQELDKEGYSENLVEQLTLLEGDYAELKLELQDNYADERLINCMIKNYQLRLQIIEQYLNQIKLNHTQNPENHENLKH